MSDWRPLDQELDRWAAAGRKASLWWRDDDAGAPTAALERLLDLAARSGQPLALAVIPDRAEAALAERLSKQAPDIAVLQHGFAHRNHAPDGEKKCELTAPRQRPETPEELGRGREILKALFGARALPVLVPPWNRIDPEMTAALPALGFTGLSTYKARKQPQPRPGLQQVNCHLDILQWRPERRFLGFAEAVALLTDHLRARREGSADPAEPSGILSHHAVHDEAAWAFLEDLLERLARHPAVRFLPAAEAFAPDRRLETGQPAEAGRRAGGGA